jgi:hypothetical protein
VLETRSRWHSRWHYLQIGCHGRRIGSIHVKAILNILVFINFTIFPQDENSYRNAEKPADRASIRSTDVSRLTSVQIEIGFSIRRGLRQRKGGDRSEETVHGEWG